MFSHLCAQTVQRHGVARGRLADKRMETGLLITVLACLSLAVPAEARRKRGGVAARSDSGRSLLPRSEQDEHSRGLGDGEHGGAGDADWRPRGSEPGLAPWPLQVRLAVEEQRRGLEAPLLHCRSRFVHALRAAGPGAERAANAAVDAGRDLLDHVMEGVLASVPQDLEADPEIAAVQASLDAGQRYPAGDILESRWRRLVRVSRAAPDDAVLEARRRVRQSAVPLWRAVKQALLDAGADHGVGDGGDDRPRVRLPVDAGAKDTLAKFRRCLQHRLLPRGVDDEAADGGHPAE